VREDVHLPAQFAREGLRVRKREPTLRRPADVAEFQLGMSSLSLHGAHEVAPYMPKGMQDAGTAMHRSASQFAVAAKEASIDHDVPRALGALTKVTQACVGCHAGYRLKQRSD